MSSIRAAAAILLCSLCACHAFRTSVLHRPAIPSLLCLRASNVPDSDPAGKAEDSVQVGSVSRRALLQAAVVLPLFSASSVSAGLLDGGPSIGWGDATKAGVNWGGGFANPLSSQPPDYAAEVVNGKGNPVLISFTKPKSWKVSTNTGIAIQDYVTTDSAYVLVAPAKGGLDAKELLDKVFDIKGRYGTFGKIDNIKISKQRLEQEGNTEYLYLDFKFTSLSPGGREIDRNACIKATLLDGDAVMLVASSNSNRWNKVKDTIAVSVTSFSVIPTPKTSLKGGQVESEIGNKEALGVAGYDLLRFDSPVWTN